MRRTYVQDPVTLELIPKEEYQRRVDVDAPMVMADIQPYQSQVTGEMITSRSHHRAHLKQHKCVEIGNELSYLKNTPKALPSLKEQLIRAVNSRR